MMTTVRRAVPTASVSYYDDVPVKPVVIIKATVVED
jgi:hypothetical protein